MTTDAQRYEHWVNLLRLARGLEAEGFYNAAKLFWSLVFSEQIRASNTRDLPRVSNNQLDPEFAAMIEALRSAGVQPEVVAALETAHRGMRENRVIAYSEVPDVSVCRRCGEIILGGAPERCPACGAHRLTFHQAPAAYYFDRLSPQQVVAALESGPDRVAAAIAGLNEQQMAQVPAPGEWSARELLWHLMVTQELLARRVVKLLTEEQPSLSALGPWNMGTVEQLSGGGILERYRASRDETLERLRSVAPGDWQRAGWHEEFGQVTLLDQATYFARHEHSHLAQFDFIRRSIGA